MGGHALKNMNPGSDYSISLGCTCPVLDNGHGSDIIGVTRGFWISENCPLHSKNVVIDEQIERRSNAP